MTSRGVFANLVNKQLKYLSRPYSTFSSKRYLYHKLGSSSLQSISLFLQQKRFCHQHVTSADIKRIGRILKSHSCGELTKSNIGEKVKLRGLLIFRRYGKFIVIKDRYGVTQAVINDNNLVMIERIKSTPYESYIEIEGIVQERPKEQQRKDSVTGDIEIYIESYKIISEASTSIPFLTRNKTQPNESIRMKYRYLDLRSDQMQKTLELRSTTSKKIRDFLQDKMGFMEITTPTLSINTPGGAQEFVVPTQSAGEFFSLVQSPQTFKQLAMMGGIDRYFQFAICYRDESFRSDRQPEFMQVDIEMTDITMEEMRMMIENLMMECWPKHLPTPKGFPLMDYDDAIKYYGCDKPDTRFDWKIKEVTDIIEMNVSFEDKNKSSSSHAFVIPQGKNYIPRRVKDDWNQLAKVEQNLNGVHILNVIDKNTLKGNLPKNSSNEFSSKLIEELKAEPMDTIILATGKYHSALALLGKLRLLGANLLEEKGVIVRDPNHFNFVWIINFPLFELDEQTGKICSVHHPFTRPIEEQEHLLFSDPLKIKSQHYDLVLNGSEIAGGSIRLHETDLQNKVFKILDIDPASFGFFSEALSYGAPPHGGIAIGYDRFIAILCGKENIRDVIAFPKASSGRCLMTGAPSNITEHEKNLYNIKIKNES